MSCPSDCGHTPEQHDAFDAGAMASLHENPYDPKANPDLWEAWESGYSVGQENDL